MIHLQGGEYIYLDNVHLEGSNRETEQVGLEVVSSAELYIDDCDFCNFKNGKAIYFNNSNTNNRTDHIYIDNTSFVRNLYSIYCNTSWAVQSLHVNNCFLFAVNPTGYTETFFYSARNSGSIGILNQAEINNLQIRHGGTGIDSSHNYFNVSAGNLIVNNLDSISKVGYSNNVIMTNANVPTNFRWKDITTIEGQTDYKIGTYNYYHTKSEYPILRSIERVNGYPFTDEILNNIKVEYNSNGDLYLKFPSDPGEGHWIQFNICMSY